MDFAIQLKIPSDHYKGFAVTKAMSEEKKWQCKVYDVISNDCTKFTIHQTKEQWWGTKYYIFNIKIVGTGYNFATQVRIRDDAIGND